MIEARTKIINMTEYDPDYVTAIVDYTYTYTIRLSRHNVIGITQLANMYMMSDVIDACVDYLSDSIDSDNIDCISNLSRELDSIKLKSAIVSYISDNMYAVSSSDVFLELPYEKLLRILLHDCTQYKYNKRKIIDRLLSYLNYVSYDIDNRAWHLDDTLTRYVVPDLPFVSPRARSDILESYHDNIIIKNKLSMLFDDIPVINTIEPINSDTRSYSTSITHTDTTDSDIEPILESPILLKYDHIIGIDFYYNEATKFEQQYDGMSIYYVTGVTEHIRSHDRLYPNDILRLSLEDDERIIDAVVYRIGFTIYSISFVSNLNRIHGPYGTVNNPMYSLDTRSSFARLSPCTDRCYLSRIWQLSPYKSLSVWKLDKLVFTWIPM